MNPYDQLGSWASQQQAQANNQLLGQSMNGLGALLGGIYYGQPQVCDTSFASAIASPWMYQAQQMQNAWKPPPKFPRTDTQRIERMNRYVDWKRTKLRQRLGIHLAVVGAILLLTPVVIAALSWVWRFAIDGVLG